MRRWAAGAVPGGETPGRAPAEQVSLGSYLSYAEAVGAAFAAAGYALTGGRRDVVSRNATVPGRFEVLVAAGYGDRARAVLGGAAR